jgi:hypothetical protein
LFCDQSGGVMAFGTIRNRLAYLQRLEGAPVEERFSPHALRRACATRNYERGVDLVAIQQQGCRAHRRPRLGLAAGLQLQQPVNGGGLVAGQLG